MSEISRPELEQLRLAAEPVDQQVIDYALSLESDVARLQQWVHDLQDEGWVNCVYCGWRAGPTKSQPPALHQRLYDHVLTCEKHPAAGLRAEVARLRALPDVGALVQQREILEAEIRRLRAEQEALALKVARAIASKWACGTVPTTECEAIARRVLAEREAR